MFKLCKSLKSFFKKEFKAYRGKGHGSDFDLKWFKP